jgi:hypothetical protein
MCPVALLMTTRLQPAEVKQHKQPRSLFSLEDITLFVFLSAKLFPLDRWSMVVWSMVVWSMVVWSMVVWSMVVCPMFN